MQQSGPETVRPDGTGREGSAKGLEPLIELSDVTVRYGAGPGSVLAVDKFSLAIPQRCFLSIIGPSGCGKSSVLNLIAGYHKPSSGTVRMNGIEIVGPGPERMVVHQQSTALLPWFSAARNVALALTARGQPKAAAREGARHYLNMVGLAGFDDHPIYQLSGGMRQRLALARALATEAKVILLDEPLGAIDALQRAVLQDLLIRLWDETHTCFVMITHSVEEAVYVSTDVISMSARPGRIIRQQKFDFNRSALAGANSHVRASPEFAKAEEELYETLTAASSGKTAPSEGD